MGAIGTINQQTARDFGRLATKEPSVGELHQSAVRATLIALAAAAKRNDHAAALNFSAAVRNLEGGS